MSDPSDRGHVDHYGAQYGNFGTDVFAEVRAETFGTDYGQNGWQTADEHDRFVAALAIGDGSRLLDVACGSGGPALRAAERSGCSVVGVDVHEDAIATARRAAEERGLTERATFVTCDANGRLPFDDASFDAVLCIDAINHLPDRAGVLEEWCRLLQTGGRLVFTDPVVVTGWLTDSELRIRSSVGSFLFVPKGIDEVMLAAAGFTVCDVTDVTENMATIALRWRDARERRADALRRLEGESAYSGQQIFFDVAARLANERRLSRLLFVAEKR